MNSLFKSEFKRQLTNNPLFWTCVAIGVCIALLAALIEIQIELNTLEATLQQGDHLSYNTLLSVISAYTAWIPTRIGDFYSGLYYLLWPLLATIPASWILSNDSKEGVLEQQCLRIKKASVIRIKLYVSFISGGICSALPLILNFLAVICFLPLSTPKVYDEIYTAVPMNSLFSGLFYNSPLAYVTILSVLTFMIGGLFSCTVSLFASLTKTTFQAIFISYFLLHLLAFLGSQFSAILSSAQLREVGQNAFIKLNFFQLISSEYAPTKLGFYCFCFALMLLITFISYKKTCRSDLL
ncbi:hypothetical protein [Lancefieldella parvula]|uniref:hypothetical protein n=1 Tax=Lancefieldella parvula TaxID=1382 RepID=UPI0028894280|nr:hypothetical protein [Lancefieldella parvula]